MMYEAIKQEQVPLAVRYPLRTLLVDDSREFLSRLEKWLVGHPDFEIVGKAYSGFEAVRLARVLRPALVVMDIAMPLMNGYEAAVRMKEGGHCPTVILISFFERRGVQEGSDVKADAFIEKDSLYEELFPTVARLFHQRRAESVL